MLSSGVMMSLQTLPWVVRWVHWATPFPYAVSNVIMLEFFYKPAKTDCLLFVSPMLRYFIDATGTHRGWFLYNMLFLVGFIIIFFLAFTFILRMRGKLASA